MQINAKTAKKLRAMARNLVAEQHKKDSATDISEHYLENTANRKQKAIQIGGQVVPFETLGTLHVNPHSVKGTYRRLKKAVRRADAIKFA